MIESGNPMPSRRAGEREILTRGSQRDLDASANNNRANVISAKWCTAELSTSTVTIPQLEFPRRKPAIVKIRVR